jgi:hypothetical protein
VYAFTRKLDPSPSLDRTAPDILTFNGRDFDLREGRLLFLQPDGSVSQMNVFPVLAAARNVDALAGLEKENELGNSIRALNRQLREMRNRYTDASPEVIQLTARLAELEKQLHAAATRTQAASRAPKNRGMMPGGDASAGGENLNQDSPTIWLEIKPNGSVVFAGSGEEIALDDLVANVKKRAPVARSVGIRAGAEVPFHSVVRVTEALQKSGYGLVVGQPKPVVATPVETGPSPNAQALITEIEFKVMRQQYEKVLQQLFDTEFQIAVNETRAPGAEGAEGDAAISAKRDRAQVLRRYAERLRNEILAKNPAPGMSSPGGNRRP